MKVLILVAIVKLLATSAFAPQASPQHNSTNAFCDEPCYDHSALAADLVTMKEVLTVKIYDPKSIDPPFTSAISETLPRSGNLYTTFEVSGQQKGKSTSFDNAHEAYANLPFEACDPELELPVTCKIKQRRRFRRDKTIYTADLFLTNDQDDPETGIAQVSGIIHDNQGRDIGLALNAEVCTTEWNSENLGQEQECTQQPIFYFRLMEMLDQLVDPNLGGTEILEKPTKRADQDITIESDLDGLLQWPADDEFLGKPLALKTTLWLANKFLPKSDRTSPIFCRASAINDARLYLRDGVRSPYEGRWTDALSDDSLQRVFFSSLGMEYVQTNPENGGYIVDLTLLGHLSYKDSMENLGCTVHFDSNGSVIQIENYEDGIVHFPGDETWEWAKLKARSNVFLLASLEHLMIYHFIWASAPAEALRMFLPPTHPIRMAFSPHFYRTHWTCSQAKEELVDEFGVIGRVIPFQYDGGYRKALIHFLKTFEFQTFPDQLESQGVMDCNFHIGSSDGIALHKILVNYASNLFDEVYETEARFLQDETMRDLYKYLRTKMNGLPAEYTMANVKLVWGEILFRVTGGHNSIGNSAAYALDPFLVNLRMLKQDKGKVQCSKESDIAIRSITKATIPNECPRLYQDWSHVLHDPQSFAYATLRSDLSALGELIDKRNDGKDRRFVNRDFHPNHCAISTFG